MIHLQTPRLTIRPVLSSDLNSIHHLHSLPETDEFNTLGIPENLHVTQKIVNQWIDELLKNPIQYYTFAIELKENPQFAGLIAINLGNPKYKLAETWFKLHPDVWGKGFATEALRVIIHFGFNELKLHRIEAGCAVANIASMKVMEKAGMKQEGRTRKKLPLKSGWSDNYEYAILADDIR